jgi:type VI secretion system protein ImpA
MGFDDNPQLSDLLTPIPGENRVGEDLKYSNEFSEIELAHHQGQQAIPPIHIPGGAGPEAEEAFGRVVDKAPDFLTSQSKDLRVASFLCSALLRVGIGDLGDPAATRCFAGFRFGLELLKGMMEEYWEDMHPSVASRWASLSALSSPDMIYPVRQVPLTVWGHGQAHFKGWVTEADPGQAPGDDDILWIGNFEDGFNETDREYYEALSEEMERCTTALEELDELARELFKEAGESPPSFGDLKKALKDVSSAAQQLLQRKPGPEPEVEEPQQEEDPGPVETTPGEQAELEGEWPDPEEEPDPPWISGEEGDPDVAPAPPQVNEQASTPEPPPAPPPAAAAEPRDAEEAAGAVAAAAKVLRRENPRNPIPYLLLRSLRWGEVRGTEDQVNPQLLEAPTSEERKRLRRLFLDESWEELLEATEEVMSSEAGRGWLDLQRYAILAADHLGSEFAAVANGIRGALRSHLADLPDLSEATLMDDSAAASPDTRMWLEAAGFTASDDSDGLETMAPDDTDPEQIRREASFDRASKMVQAGDTDGAIQLLMGRANRERSERASFVVRGEAARIMVERGETSVARPILDELLAEIDSHNLEDWEAGDVVAKPLGLLLQCLSPSEGPLRQQVYERICRLDPLLARALGNSGHAD